MIPTGFELEENKKFVCLDKASTDTPAEDSDMLFAFNKHADGKYDADVDPTEQ